jgi:hypothetical protein
MQNESVHFTPGTILFGSASVCKMEMGLLRPGSPKCLKPMVSTRPFSASLSRNDLPQRKKSAPWNFEFNPRDGKLSLSQFIVK